MLMKTTGIEKTLLYAYVRLTFLVRLAEHQFGL